MNFNLFYKFQYKFMFFFCILLKKVINIQYKYKAYQYELKCLRL